MLERPKIAATVIFLTQREREGEGEKKDFKNLETDEEKWLLTSPFPSTSPPPAHKNLGHHG